MDQQAFSFEETGAADAAPADLKLLNQKLDEAVTLKEFIDQMEDDLSAAKKTMNHLNTVTLPDLMAEIGVEEITQRGWKVKVADFVSGSLPKEADKRAVAISWLVSHGGGDLIKSDLKVTFGRDDYESALKLAKSIEDSGYAPSLESGVHPQTLAAFARERIKNGEPVDTEMLGLYTGRVAKYTKTKA